MPKSKKRKKPDTPTLDTSITNHPKRGKLSLLPVDDFISSLTITNYQGKSSFQVPVRGAADTVKEKTSFAKYINNIRKKLNQFLLHYSSGDKIKVIGSFLTTILNTNFNDGTWIITPHSQDVLNSIFIPDYFDTNTQASTECHFLIHIIKTGDCELMYNIICLLNKAFHSLQSRQGLNSFDMWPVNLDEIFKLFIMLYIPRDETCLINMILKFSHYDFSTFQINNTKIKKFYEMIFYHSNLEKNAWRVFDRRIMNFNFSLSIAEFLTIMPQPCGLNVKEILTQWTTLYSFFSRVHVGNNEECLVSANQILAIPEKLLNCYDEQAGELILLMIRSGKFIRCIESDSSFNMILRFYNETKFLNKVLKFIDDTYHFGLRTLVVETVMKIVEKAHGRNDLFEKESILNLFKICVLDYLHEESNDNHCLYRFIPYFSDCLQLPQIDHANIDNNLLDKTKPILNALFNAINLNSNIPYRSGTIDIIFNILFKTNIKLNNLDYDNYKLLICFIYECAKTQAENVTQLDKFRLLINDLIIQFLTQFSLVKALGLYENLDDEVDKYIGLDILSEYFIFENIDLVIKYLDHYAVVKLTKKLLNSSDEYHAGIAENYHKKIQSMIRMLLNNCMKDSTLRSKLHGKFVERMQDVSTKLFNTLKTINSSGMFNEKTATFLINHLLKYNYLFLAFKEIAISHLDIIQQIAAINDPHKYLYLALCELSIFPLHVQSDEGASPEKRTNLRRALAFAIAEVLRTTLINFDVGEQYEMELIESSLFKLNSTISSIQKHVAFNPNHKGNTALMAISSVIEYFYVIAFSPILSKYLHLEKCIIFKPDGERFSEDDSSSLEERHNFRFGRSLLEEIHFLNLGIIYHLLIKSDIILMDKLTSLISSRISYKLNISNSELTSNRESSSSSSSSQNNNIQMSPILR